MKRRKSSLRESGDILIAIYCRQSVDKKDSISIETQEQECRSKLKAGEENVAIYSDKGYSGKNTNRPDFQRLMRDVAAGRISKVIVYKIDRMSRSVLDFELTYRELKQHNVDFVSATENFDTSNFTGEAILRVILTFAQLERETIQKRVTDNFYSRAEKGFFMAGKAPLGYTKIEDAIDGKKTSRLAEDTTTSPLIRYIYRSYLSGDSIGEIVAKLNSENCEIKHEIKFNNVRISRILANPVYVRANADVYAYYKGAGAVLHNGVEEFDGLHGCTIYGRRQGKTKSKFRDLAGEHIQLNRHEGLISAEDWLRVQYRLSENKALKNSGSGTHSWLSGLVKCGYCGYAATVVSGQPNGKRYVYCGGRKHKLCHESKGGLTFEEIEEAVEKKLVEYAKNLKYETNRCVEINLGEINSLKAQKIKLEEEIDNIVNSFALATSSILQIKLNERISDIERQIQEIDGKLAKLAVSRANVIDENAILPLLEEWDELDFEDKKEVAKLLIKRVVVYDSKTPIEVEFAV